MPLLVAGTHLLQANQGGRPLGMAGKSAKRPWPLRATSSALGIDDVPPAHDDLYIVKRSIHKWWPGFPRQDKSDSYGD